MISQATVTFSFFERKCGKGVGAPPVSLQALEGHIPETKEPGLRDCAEERVDFTKQPLLRGSPSQPTHSEAPLPPPDKGTELKPPRRPAWDQGRTSETTPPPPASIPQTAERLLARVVRCRGGDQKKVGYITAGSL